MAVKGGVRKLKKIGLIINPIAGIGGKVGLKGSDGVETYRRALALGAVPECGKKVLAALRELKNVQNEFEIYTYSGSMGEEVCREAGLGFQIVGQPGHAMTFPEDTKQAAKKIVKMGVDILVFAGGDGTARDILDAVGMEVPVLGIPAGCKIHSGVYAVNPAAAGRLLSRYVQGKARETEEAEVMDIDETLFREGVVQARLYGYLNVLKEQGFVQNRKSGGSVQADSVEAIANYLADLWEEDVLYIVGTGSTTAAIMKRMGFENTLLGVDLVYGKQVIAKDCTEQEILEKIREYDKIKILVTVIGGQGYIFGRGNQQISAEVIRKTGRENIIVAAAKEKMLSLHGKPLYVDTGNPEVDNVLSGYIRVVVGYRDLMIARVSN